MHYKNGRKANPGDKVVMFASYGIPVVGIIYDLDENNEAPCNGRIAAISQNDPVANLSECLHLDDLRMGHFSDETPAPSVAEDLKEGFIIENPMAGQIRKLVAYLNERERKELGIEEPPPLLTNAVPELVGDIPDADLPHNLSTAQPPPNCGCPDCSEIRAIRAGWSPITMERQ